MRQAIPAIFLDRDGTIIVERRYLSDPAGVVLEEGAGEGLRLLQAQGWPLVVISNQSGVGRGYFPESAVHAVNARLAELLMAEGVTIAGWYHCPHAPDAGCDCRKPADGMVRRAAAELGLDPGRSFVIGDKRSDLELAERIGATGVLVATGYGDAAAGCANLVEAAGLVLDRAKVAK